MLRRPDPATERPLPAWLRHTWNAPWLWMALVIGLFCVPLFVGLDRRDLDNDEAIYSFGVDTMLKTGDWLTPRSIFSETTAYLNKPPLKFWIVALPIHLGLLPQNEFGMRFWDAVMGSVAFLYVFAIGRRLAGPLCGFTAVLLLFEHGPLILQHGLRTNNMEAAVFLTYAAGIYHFLAWRSGGPDDRGHVFAIALYFALGFMTKSVAALFLPVILGMAALLQAEARFRLRMNWLTFVLAALLAVALIAPWFVYQQWVRPSELMATMFGEQVLKRFTAYVDPAHVHPWYYYLTELWAQLRGNASALLTLAGAALLLYRVVRRRWVEGALVVLWFALPVAAISFGTSKLYHYIYPFLPPVALAGGYAVAKIVEWTWRWLKRPVEALASGRDRPLLRAIVTVAIFLWLVPLAALGSNLRQTASTSRPLQDLRACLTPIVAREVDRGRKPPGVWVEGGALAHSYYYYLRGLGPWQPRDIGSDSTVAMHLFAPAAYRPVLLSDERRAEFLAHLASDTPGVLALAARKAGADTDELLQTQRDAELGTFTFASATLFLPGPYRACAPDRIRTSDRP